MSLTLRLKKLLIAAGIMSIFFMVSTWVILPRVFPSVACVYETSSGATMKGWGEEFCSQQEGAIVLLCYKQKVGDVLKAGLQRNQREYLYRTNLLSSCTNRCTVVAGLSLAGT